jgi:hypothetical protein
MPFPGYVSGSSNWGRALQANTEWIGGIVTGSVAKEFVSLAVASGSNIPVKGGSGFTDPKMYLSSSFSEASGSVIQALNQLKAQQESANELSELTDVNVTGLGDGNLLFYDTGTSKWRNYSLSGEATSDDVGEVTLTATNTTLTTLANVTTVGALNAGSITSGFGDIDNGTSAIQTGGKMVLDVLGTDIDADGALTMGAAQQGAIYAEATGLVLDAKTGLDVEFHVDGVKVAHIDDDGMDLVAGDAYQINGASVLNATTLGSSVVTTSATTVGALAAGSIASGFGAISTANDITTTKEFVIDADGTAIGAAGALTLGDGQDASIYWDATDLRIDTAAGADISFRQGGTELASLDEAGLDLASGDAYFIDGDSVLNATTLGGAVVGSSLTSVGTITAGVWTGTDVAVGAGGTGASNASDARTNLGLAIGSDVQAFDVVLEDLAAMTAVDAAGKLIVSTDAGVYAHQTLADVRGGMGLAPANSPTFAGLTLTGRLSVGESGGSLNQIYLWGTDASGNAEQYSIHVAGGILNVGLV